MRGYLSLKTVSWLLVLPFVIGLATGYVIFGPSNKSPIPSVLARTQVKFLPFPPGEMLKSETIIWIDPGWDVVGVTKERLILKMTKGEG